MKDCCITILEVSIDHNNATSNTNTIIFMIILIDNFIKFLSTLYSNAIFQTMKQNNILCLSNSKSVCKLQFLILIYSFNDR